ncbi:MAG: OsmC family protein [Anaerolineae bacterium]
MAANVHLRLDDGYKAIITTRGLTLIADEPPEDGGTNQGMKPTELLIASLAACAAITAKMYAQRKGWPLTSVEIDADFEKIKARDYPAYQGESDIIHEIKQRIIFKGDLDADQRARLLEIAGKCPVHRVLTSPNFLIEELLTEEEASGL